VRLARLAELAQSQAVSSSSHRAAVLVDVAAVAHDFGSPSPVDVNLLAARPSWLAEPLPPDVGCVVPTKLPGLPARTAPPVNPRNDSLLLSHHTQFVLRSPTAVAQAATSQAVQAAADARRSLLESLVAQQFPPADACSSTRRLLIFSHPPDTGLGAELHWLQVALVLASLTNRTLVVRERGWTWTAEQGEGNHCASRTWSCVFEPLSSCEAVDDDDDDDTGSFARLVAPQRPSTLPTVEATGYDAEPASSARVVLFRLSSGLARSAPPWLTPPPGATRLGWWRTQSAAFLFRPRPHLHGLPARAAPSTPPLATVHLRGGDKVHGNEYQVVESTGTGTWARARAILDAVARTGCLQDELLSSSSRVFVSTRVPAEAAAAAADGAVLDAGQLRYGNGFHSADVVRGDLDPLVELLHAVRDVMLLVDSPIFLGPMESNLARLVAEVGQAHGRFSHLPLGIGDGGYIVWP